MAGFYYFILGCCIISQIQGAAIDISTCGSAKGCFGLPVGCITDGTTCQAVATWRPNGNKISFELSVKTPGGTNAYYVSLGTLEPGSSGMSNAIVLDCIGSSSNPLVKYATNKGTTSPQLTVTPGLTTISTEFANGEIRCFFERDQTISSNAANFLDLGAGKSYKINMAYGTTGSGGKNYHDARAASATEVDFTKTAISQGAASRSISFVKAHACLMIASWVLLAGTAITLARYYKDMWPGKNVPVYKKPIWFSFHVFCNIAAVACTIIAFILIFYFKQEWSYLDGESPTILRSHPYLGVIVTACAVINPVMAIFRPHPGAKRRPIFNWFHWLVGTIAIICGILTIFSGLNLKSTTSFTAPWMTRLLLAFVVFAILLEIFLELVRYFGNRTKANAEIEMNAPGEPPEKGRSNAVPASILRSILFALYVLFALGTTIALIVGIGVI